MEEITKEKPMKHKEAKESSRQRNGCVTYRFDVFCYCSNVFVTLFESMWHMWRLEKCYTAIDFDVFPSYCFNQWQKGRKKTQSKYIDFVNSLRSCNWNEWNRNAVFRECRKYVKWMHKQDISTWKKKIT